MRRALCGLAVWVGFVLVVTIAAPAGAQVGNTPSIWSVDLHAPYHAQATGYYCGAATAQMWIQYATGSLVDQDTLFWGSPNGIWENNWEPWYWYTSPHGLAVTLSFYLKDSGLSTFADPATVSEYSYTDPSIAVVYQAQSLLTYHQPTAALSLHGNHWMLVEGVAFQEQPKVIKGFFVHDPWAYTPSYGSIGEDSYKTLVAWVQVYFTPNVFGEMWYQDWVTVEYSPSGLHAVDAAPAFAYAPGLPPMSPKGVTIQDVVTAAKQGFADNGLDQATDFGPSFSGAEAQDPILVRSLRADIPDYYIVPFAAKGHIVGAALVDAENGVFLEASPGTMPSGGYLPLTPNQVTKTMQALAGERLAGSPVLSWMPLDTPSDMYHPFWVGTTVSGAQVVVDLSGSPLTL